MLAATERPAGDERLRLEKALDSHVADPDKRVFAVIDGAKFPDLPTRLVKASVAHFPLYQGSDRDLIEAGPWLVSLYRFHAPADDFYGRGGLGAGPSLDERETDRPDPRRQLESILQIATQSHGLVFWIGDASLTEEGFSATCVL